MTTISTTTPRAATGAASSAASSSATGAGAATATTSAADQQDRFMQLLVAQMRNQDPLNPMDNAQMTTQIAQINTVAGVEKLNKTVEGLASDLHALLARSAAATSGSNSAASTATPASKETQS